LDIVLDSKVFKCMICRSLTNVTKKEIHYNNNDSSVSSRPNEEENYRQNLLSLMQNKNIFPNSSTNHHPGLNFNSIVFNSEQPPQTSSNYKVKSHCKFFSNLVNNEGISDFNQISNKSFQSIATDSSSNSYLTQMRVWTAMNSLKNVESGTQGCPLGMERSTALTTNVINFLF
jgi:hypothetical protein